MPTNFPLLIAIEPPLVYLAIDEVTLDVEYSMPSTIEPK